MTIYNRLTWCLLAALVLAGCATPVQIQDSWRNPQAPQGAYKKLLVVAVTNENNLRALLENTTVQTLEEHGVAAVPSYKLIPDLAQANRTRLKTEARNADADAVLITNAISREERTNYYYGKGLQRRTAVMVDEGADSTTVVAMSAIGIASNDMDYVKGFLQTRLFDTASEKMVWLAHTKAVVSDNRVDACWQFAILMTKAAAQDRMIDINSREFRKPTQ